MPKKLSALEEGRSVQQIVEAITQTLDRQAINNYISLFIMPRIERLEAAGVSEADQKRLCDLAVKGADLTTVGQAPGSRLQSMVDLIEAGATVEEVLQRF